MMDTVEVQLVKLVDGRIALKYPKTGPLWDMEGYYLPSQDGGTLLKMSTKHIEFLVPKSEPRVVEIKFEDD
jgi:hypothetical protein